MTSCTQIREILMTMEKNKWHKLPDIKKFLKSKIEFNGDDDDPITPNNQYRKWNHRLQAVLHSLVVSGGAEHTGLVSAKKSPDGKKKEPRYKFNI